MFSSLLALGLKKTVEHVDDQLSTVAAVALCGGLALYYLSHVAMRMRLRGHAPSNVDGPWLDRPRQARHGDRHARFHPRGFRTTGADGPRTGRSSVLRARRLGCRP